MTCNINRAIGAIVTRSRHPTGCIVLAFQCRLKARFINESETGNCEAGLGRDHWKTLTQNTGDLFQRDAFVDIVFGGGATDKFRCSRLLVKSCDPLGLAIDERVIPRIGGLMSMPMYRASISMKRVV
jgi:hypothetical protein